jgi:hypothetical protein
MSRHNVAIISGQIRDEHVFRCLLVVLIACRVRNIISRIVVSTWTGDVDVFPGLRQYLDDSGVELVESFEPLGFPNKGHFYHQMKSMQMGLNSCRPGDWILKLRPDIYVKDVDAIEFICGQNLFLPSSFLRTVFNYQIWTPYFEIASPFYLCDIMYYGDFRDISLITTMDATIDIMGDDYPNTHIKNTFAEPEVRRFIAPFLGHFPILADFYKIIRLTGYCTQARPFLFEYFMSSPFFLKVLSLYYLLVHIHFRVGGRSLHHKLYLARKLSVINNSDLNIEGFTLLPHGSLNLNDFSRNFSQSNVSPITGLHYCDDGEWLDNIINGSINDPFIRGNNMYAYMIKALTYKSDDNSLSEFQEFKRIALEIFNRHTQISSSISIRSF